VFGIFCFPGFHIVGLTASLEIPQMVWKSQRSWEWEQSDTCQKIYKILGKFMGQLISSNKVYFQRQFCG